MDEILKDERFAHIPRDPAFKRIPKKERKVRIDKRFQSMFNDKRFKVKYTVDKRGRPVQNSSTENLRRYYALESSDESEEASSDENGARSKLKEVSQETLSKGCIVKPEEKRSLKNEKLKDSTVLKNTDIGKFKKVKRKDYGNKDYFSDERSLNKKGSNNIQLNRSSEEEEDDDDDDNNSDFPEENGNDDLDREFCTASEKTRARLQDLSVDYARGEGVLLSDSSSDEESSDEEDEEEEVDHEWGELDGDAETTEESTRRLALCNMDWDRINAKDLMVLFNSFLPKGGVIHSVTVYPSEYGVQRMREEDAKGPQELRMEGVAVAGGRTSDDEEEEDEDEDEEDGRNKTQSSDEEDRKKKLRDDDEVEEGDDYQREKLRQYQLKRLRYFYAVIECDSVPTADALYKVCDGMEYESSASHLDLRFIPDDTTFEQEPRETCNRLPDMMKYEPQLFITKALQQSKVRLTWDETDPRRLKFNEKVNSGNVDDIDDNDLKVYLATSSSEAESSADEGKKESASKYRALLDSVESQEAAKKEKAMEMQVTWGIDLKGKVERRLKDGAKAEELTPFQQYVQKRKEKKRAKREEQLRKRKEHLQQQETAEEDEDSASEDDVPSDIDMNDAYFKEEFEKDEFALTKRKESKNKKNKKKKGEESDEESKRKKAELELLLMDQDDNKKHFSLKDILVEDTKSKKKKNKKRKEEIVQKKEDDFQINIQDNRFSALFTSHLYNIDPADPHYKKTKGMEALRQEKLNRRGLDEEVPTKKQKTEIPEKKNAELSLLVKNIKRKTQTLKM